MRRYPIAVTIVAAALTATCTQRVPESVGIPPGTPHVSWILMYGDSDNPDSEFACQSYPRTECVIPASKSDSILNSSVIGIVTSTPGPQAVTVSLDATVTNPSKTQAIRESIPVVVK